MIDTIIKPTRLDPIESILTLDLSSWDEFEEIVKALYNNERQPDPTRIGHVSPFLFRGQRNAKWQLKTTLERQGKTEAKLIDYFKTITRMLSVVESHTNKRFELPDFHEYFKRLEETQSPFHASSIPGFEFMVYLRHFGFPSPLLDWTESPYIAAYFAYSDVCTCDSGRVAIYLFQEHAGYGKVTTSMESNIYTQERNSRKHKRHFLQQCSYTTCIKRISDLWIYAQYSSATKTHHKNQDIIRKITIPESERVNVLKTLNRHNINDYSLFESEESLMKAMAIQLFDFKTK